MATNLKSLYTGQPATTLGTLVSAIATGVQVKVQNVILCNTTGAAATITLYKVPSAGTAGVTNAILSSFSVAASDTVVIDLDMNLVEGHTIQGLQGTAGAITVDINGVEKV
jgi:hypothetical protein